MRRIIALGATAIVVLCWAAPAGAVEITPVKVIDEPGNQQFSPSGNGAWFAFTANTDAHPNRFNAYAQTVAGSDRTRLNPKGTRGNAGNFDPGTNTAIYYQYSDTARSNLWFFDLATTDRSKVPGVNTKWFEYDGLVSSSYVLFDRDHRVNGTYYTDLILFDRADHAGVTLGSWKSGHVYVFTGSVGETTASYEVVKTKPTFTITSYVYDIAGHTRSKIPVPAGKFAYGPTVDEANQEVYFSRSGNGCGLNVTIRRVSLANLDAHPEVMASMPDGVDAGELSLAPNIDTGNTDLLFTRYSCPTGKQHVFELPGVDAP
jgi:hypothetical protein